MHKVLATPEHPLVLCYTHIHGTNHAIRSWCLPMRLRMQKKGLSNVQLSCSSLSTTLTHSQTPLFQACIADYATSPFRGTHMVCSPTSLSSAGASGVLPALSRTEASVGSTWRACQL